MTPNIDERESVKDRLCFKPQDTTQEITRDANLHTKRFRERRQVKPGERERERGGGGGERGGKTVSV